MRNIAFILALALLGNTVEAKCTPGDDKCLSETSDDEALLQSRTVVEDEEDSMEDSVLGEMENEESVLEEMDDSEMDDSEEEVEIMLNGEGLDWRDMLTDEGVAFMDSDEAKKEEYPWLYEDENEILDEASEIEDTADEVEDSSEETEVEEDRGRRRKGGVFKKVSKAAKKVVKVVKKALPSFSTLWRSVTSKVKGMNSFPSCGNVNDCKNKLIRGPAQLFNRIAQEAGKQINSAVNRLVGKAGRAVQTALGRAKSLIKQTKSKVAKMGSSMSKVLKGATKAIKRAKLDWCTPRGMGYWRSGITSIASVLIALEPTYYAQMKKSCVAAIFLLAAGASGTVLKSDAFLSKWVDFQSNELALQSQKLNTVLQTVADRLAPGPTKEFLRTLRLCAPCQKFQRIGEPHDGGYVMCMDGLNHGLVGAYSYGINGFDGWGMAVASMYNIPLNEYDCTNFNRPQVCSGCTVNFHGECILEHGGAFKPLYKTLATQLKESGNGNAVDRSLLLKIDVEAAEWQVFANEPVENLRKFREIVVEYHWISKRGLHPLYEQAVKKIEAAGFSVAHLHGNNYGGGLQYFGEYSIPNVLEVTYIPSPPEGCSKDIPYHVPQDMPNNAGAPEIPDAHLPSKL